jgi:hypothetical protein
MQASETLYKRAQKISAAHDMGKLFLNLLILCCLIIHDLFLIFSMQRVANRILAMSKTHKKTSNNGTLSRCHMVF